MHQHSRGFSLLEVLVAFVILGLVLGALMEIFSGGLRNVGLAGEYQHATLLGQSKLATVGIELPLKEGESNGDFDSTYRWQISIRPYQDTQLEVAGQPAGPAPAPAPASGQVPGSAPAPAPAPALAPVMPVASLEVEIKVLWGANDRVRSVSLKTLRLANKVTL